MHDTVGCMCACITAVNFSSSCLTFCREYKDRLAVTGCFFNIFAHVPAPVRPQVCCLKPPVGASLTYSCIPAWSMRLLQWPPKIMGHPSRRICPPSHVRSIYLYGCANIQIYTLEPTVHICKIFGGARRTCEGGRVPRP